MRLILKMDLDNAAFEADHEDKRNGCEVARILHRVAAHWDGYDLYRGQLRRLFDVNGNRVGEAEIVAD